MVLGFDCVELQWGWFGFGLIWGGCGGFLAISVRCGVGIIRILWVLWFRASGFVLFCVLVCILGFDDKVDLCGCGGFLAVWVFMLILVWVGLVFWLRL